MTVGKWKEIKRVVSQDGQRRMTVNMTPNDLFRFSEEAFVIEDPPSASMAPLEYWRSLYMSGLYASAEEAEKAAYMELPWLREATQKDKES